MNALPTDYEERVYAGVLGKIIGVYLGRPFEGWANERIERELGEVWYYVHEQRNTRLVVTDDDISGTFTFLRALPDHGNGHEITPAQIGQTWLNYLIEKQTVLWWGGMGVSTEHTAFLRLKHGVPAPDSGSIERNGQVVAEQIGAQIFIDGWAMVCPGDPDKAVALAGKAARVSHDGEAVYAAQVIAAMESLAFVEDDIYKLIAHALTFIPRASTIYVLIEDLLAWKAEKPHDWRATLRRVEGKYGYDKYGGGCHVVPNHAVVLLALLYSDDDFQKSLMIANTAGWDTDCNSANVGCLMGIKNGLDGINRGADFRGPVADRMYLPTADGGRCITDAAREAYEIVNIGRALQGQRPVHPNHGMRFHFALPGSLHGFRETDAPDSRDMVRLENVLTGGDIDTGAAADERMLAIAYRGVAPGRAARISTPTFTPPDTLKAGGYGMVASPTLYAGQTLRARLVADAANTQPAPAALFVEVYTGDDATERISSPSRPFAPGESSHFHWEIPATGGRPIVSVGVEVGGQAGDGTVYLDWMGWGGAPTVTLGRPTPATKPATRAWVSSADEFREGGASGRAWVVVQNEGQGLVTQGTCEWCQYLVKVEAHAHLAASWGVVVCARGLRRYVAVVVERGMARLVEQYDDAETVLESEMFDTDLGETVAFTVTTYREGTVVAHLASGSGSLTLTGQILAQRAYGAVGMLVREGHCQFGAFAIEPAPEA